MLVVGSDISESKMAVMAIQESGDRYRTLVELSPEAIVVLIGGGISLINEKATMMLGGSRSEELIGRSIYDFIHPDYKANAQVHGKKVLESKETVKPVESRLVRLDDRDRSHFDGDSI